MNEMDKLVAKVVEEIRTCAKLSKLPVLDMDITTKVIGNQIHVSVKCKVPGEKTNDLITLVYEKLSQYGTMMGVVVSNAPYEFNLTLSVKDN